MDVKEEIDLVRLFSIVLPIVFAVLEIVLAIVFAVQNIVLLVQIENSLADCISKLYSIEAIYSTEYINTSKKSNRVISSSFEQSKRQSV